MSKHKYSKRLKKGDILYSNTFDTLLVLKVVHNSSNGKTIPYYSDNGIFAYYGIDYKTFKEFYTVVGNLY